MSQPGYHPICVLFQGNDCTFDGTYRLVCRHQVRQKDFKPGENVEVDMGDDNDGDADNKNEELCPSDEDVNILNEAKRGGRGTRWRDAIALGDEMVMSLLRNMCKTQPLGKSPWGAYNQKGKRKQDPDRLDEEHATTKRIKSEPTTTECTTSQELSDNVDIRRNDQLLQKILTAVQAIKESQEVVMSEIQCIKENQHRITSQVDEIQRAVVHADKHEEIVSLDCDNEDDDDDDAAIIFESEADQSFVTPVSLYLSQTSHQRTSSSLLPTSSVPGSSQPLNRMSLPSSTAAHHSPIILPNLGGHPPDLSTFSTQQSSPTIANNAEVPLFASPPQPVGQSDFPQVTYNFRYTDNGKNRVFLGYHGSPLTLPKNEMDDNLIKTNTPAAFAYRLAGKVFTTEELLTSNTSGKSNKIGRTYLQLNPLYINIILMEVSSRFPRCRDTKEGGRRLLIAINERCRNERKKIIYRSDKSLIPDKKLTAALN